MVAGWSPRVPGHAAGGSAEVPVRMVFQQVALVVVASSLHHQEALSGVLTPALTSSVDVQVLE